MKLRLLLLLLVCTMLTKLSAQTTSKVISVNNKSSEVQLKGLVEKPLVLTVASLKTRKIAEGQNYQIISSKGELKRTINTYKGVLLKELLNEAKIVMPNQKERGKYYVLVSATDGYQVLFSWNELYNSNTGEQVYLLYEENGKEIVEDGPLVLICTGDKITGPRHVRWVKSIEVARLP